MHETNTFSIVPTTKGSFSQNGGILWLEGEEVKKGIAGTNSETCGFVEASAELGWELTTTVHGEANPGGRVTDECFNEKSDYICGTIKQLLASGGAIDGVLLALHGSMVTESHDDAEGELLRRIRTAVDGNNDNGDDYDTRIPIVVTLDLHANVSDEMLQMATAMISYRT